MILWQTTFHDRINCFQVCKQWNQILRSILTIWPTDVELIIYNDANYCGSARSAIGQEINKLKLDSKSKVLQFYQAMSRLPGRIKSLSLSSWSDYSLDIDVFKSVDHFESLESLTVRSTKSRFSTELLVRIPNDHIST